MVSSEGIVGQCTDGTKRQDIGLLPEWGALALGQEGSTPTVQ